MNPIIFSLCPESDHYPEVVIDRDGVRIGEANNTVRLNHAEWNRLVSLVHSGKLTSIDRYVAASLTPDAA